MPTDHACRAAADAVAHALGALREHLSGPGEHGGAPRLRYGEPVDGAAGLLVFLDGLHAELHGALTGWYCALDHRIRDALRLLPPVTGGAAPPAARLPSGWDGLGGVRYRAEEILTALSARPRGEAAGAAGLPRRLEVVEDVFAGALRRLGVPARESAGLAADMAAAAGSLFGMHPPDRPRAAAPPHAPAPDRHHAMPAVAFPQLGDLSQGGMP
ncbi:hypothetical protein ACFVZC_00825 [Streptomyces marokkonensis]|uniref:Uncharacterized protein n=1 Tax=Streptomyces marokkonensis TaxID=324855 RepID=A0ABW6PYJ7_9ACTN